MKKGRRVIEVFNLSFLDVISCGFGAIVLLLVIMKISEPAVIDRTTRDSREHISQLRSEIESLKERSSGLSTSAELLRAARDRFQTEVAELKKELEESTGRQRDLRVENASQQAILQQLYRARQELSREMRRLQQQTPSAVSELPIGGVPVDSEYIIFVIDTSGSMQQFAWPTVRQKMEEILTIYPSVKGIQVLNDMGDYMFSQYRGRWIPDTPARRKAILQRLRTWTPFSNSSPVEGVTAAIKRFYGDDKKISIYIFGDDFSRGSIQDVVDTVDSINRSLKDGSRRVRIHAIGFPVYFRQSGSEMNVARFSALMRRLAEDNDGSFVGLTRLR
jgi:FtsZ-binding cell division protein ZapB